MLKTKLCVSYKERNNTYRLLLQVGVVHSTNFYKELTVVTC